MANIYKNVKIENLSNYAGSEKMLKFAKSD